MRRNNIPAPAMNPSSTIQVNTTQVPVTLSKTSEIIRWSFVLLTVVGLCFFIYLIVMMLIVFFTNPQLQENARYLLFIYMLVNDAFYVFLAFYLLMAGLYLLYVPVPLCIILYGFTTSVFSVTPYNLVVMALERYIAICYPLRHTELCTTKRANMAFSLIWLLLVVLHGTELAIMFTSVTNLYRYIICKHETLMVNPIQNVIRTLNFILCFGSVGIVLIFTYVKIMLVARKVSSQSTLASKAGNTIMLHAFQLLLYMSSLLTNLTQTYLPKKIEYLPITTFFILTCAPRFLSPVIYGIRDEELRKHVKKALRKYFS
ncbi:odorant receptor 131-2-like [Phyllobates terribilis]|uniref:odorant receptor 131-2-like n=1 Tax=Phyllobates terribilis TaxID=111132 RepID=UPI003CCB6A38